MSSINDALRRANRDYSAGDVPSRQVTGAPSGSRISGPLLWAVLAVVLALSAGYYLFFYPANPSDAVRPVTAEKSAPVKAEARDNAGPAPVPGTDEKVSVPEAAPLPMPPRTQAAEPSTPAAPAPERVIEVPKPAGETNQVQAKKAVDATPAVAASPPALPDPEPAAQQPSTAEEHFLAARSAQDKGRDSQAIHEYREALRLDPRMAEAYLNLGNIFYFRQRSPEKALEMYKQVIKLDPGNKLAHNNLGVLFLRQELHDQAGTEFSAALQQDPDYVDALYNMACLAAIRGKTADAMGYLTKAVHLRPEAAFWAAEDVDLKSLRQLPEFKSLMQRANENPPRGK